MKKLFTLVTIILAMVVSSCTYDDTAVWNKLENHESRISALEELCREMNTNISALQSLVDAMQGGDYITSIVPVTKDGNTIGYTITFAENDPITIYHGTNGKDGANGADGKDGQNGTDGKDGANGADGKDGADGADGKDGADGADGKDGADGYTPVIGVKQDTDGIYYWTLDGEWLLDDAGNKIKAQGVDGKDGTNGTDGTNGADGKDGEDGKDGIDGVNGTDGKDGQDGTNGSNGKDGADGITPQLKIENGYWYVSYNNGTSWIQLGKATGEDGQDGANGADGKDGDSFFQSVDTSNPDYIVFTLTDGTEIKIPTWYSFEMLQELCNQMNSNIDAIQTIVAALQEKDYIESVTPIVEDGKEVGYTITFAKSGIVKIYHGKDGVNGADGKDGADGYTPVIGVKQDSDSIYYWTLDGEWLLDDAGNKIKAQGVDGKDGTNGTDGTNGADGKDGEDGKDGTDGVNGTDGKDGQDGANGADGTNGKDGVDGVDGITPQLKIEEGYWYVSYDNGTSWTQLGKATGEDGQDGANGADGKDGDSFFQSVIQDENNVYFTLADGTVITLPKGLALSIEFAESDLVVMSPNSSREIGYTITSATDAVKMEVTSSADIKAKAVVDNANRLTGKIHITTGDVIDEYSKVIVFVSNGDKVIMRSITFEEAGLVVEENATKQATAEGGEITLEFLSNVECEVVIPEEAQSWISVVPATRAMEKQTITLKLEPNEGATRSAEVVVKSVDGKLSLTYTITQEPASDYQLALEREALIAIYNALDGDNWTNNENWCSDKPVSEWYGVSVITNGEKEIITGLELYFNNARGDIPAEIGNLKNLRGLRIGDLYISSIPKEIGGLTNLRYLDVGGHMVKTTPKEIDNLVNLTILNLWGENVTDFQPTLSPLVNLESASIFINSGEGFVDGLAELPKLKHLEFISNMNQFPNAVRNMKQLEYLSFTYSNMQGVHIPSWLSELTNLTYLSLYGCGITGTIPEELGELVNLENLELGVNSLTGTIPESFKTLTKLQELNIKYNRLYGKIPTEIVEMPWFQYRWGEIFLGNNFDISEIELYGPKFTFTDINGTKYNSEEIYQENKYTIFYQWRPAENLETTQLLKSLYETYHDRGLEIIACTGDSSAEIIALKTPWINYTRDGGNFIYINFAPYYAIDSYPMRYWGIPCMTVINTEGEVVYSNLANNTRIDVFLAKQFDNAGSDLYTSTDYSQDGKVTTLQTATKGDGIDIVLMGDAYSDRQIADGTYEADMKNLYNNLFTEEPYKSFKDHFNVYYVDVVSKNEGYGTYSETALSGFFGAGTLVGGNDNAVFNYALKAISAEEMDEALLIVAMNSDNYAGTCYMYYPDNSAGYGNGVSVSYFPKGGDATTFAQLLHHEACGHGFAKLADEYAYEDMGAVPSDYVSEIKSQQSDWGWWKNVDFTSDPTAIRWSHFINDTRYASEGLGAYEGGLTYWTGVWRPTENSIMRYNTGGFNAPSREAIYYRIHKLAYGDSWEYNYEEFVEWDAQNRAANAKRAKVYRPANYKPTHPPVIVNKSWKDAK